MKTDEACTRRGMCWQRQMNIQGSFFVCQKKPSRWFFNLRHTLQFGIGLHHAGIVLYQHIGMRCKPSRSSFGHYSGEAKFVQYLFHFGSYIYKGF
ncbi:unnamed protein product [Prunus brigantina]